MKSTKERVKEKIKENKIFFIAIMTFLCILLMILTFNREEPDGLTNLVTRAVAPVLSFANDIPSLFSNIFSGSELYEVLYLQNQLADLQLQLSRLELLEEANREMSYLLQMKESHPTFETIGANVIASTSSNWNTEFMIDIGYSSGVAFNMVVFGTYGLVGRVILVNYDTSVVLPIIDDTSSVSATVRRSGENGFANGNVLLSLSGLLRFEAPLGTDVIVGDEIITSNLGIIFPPALTIGVVSEITEVGSSLSAVIEPLTNFRNISTVLVITNY